MTESVIALLVIIAGALVEFWRRKVAKRKAVEDAEKERLEAIDAATSPSDYADIAATYKRLHDKDADRRSNDH